MNDRASQAFLRSLHGSATLPAMARAIMPRPCVAIAIKSRRLLGNPALRAECHQRQQRLM
jgi:hypothetical protein